MSTDPTNEPEWSRRLWSKKDAQRAARHAPRNGHVPVPTAPGAADAYAKAAFDRELATLAAAEEGTRNPTLNTAAFNLAQLVGAGHLDHDATWQALHDTALRIGLTPTETVGTLRSAFGAGAKLPREIAPLAPRDVPPVTVLHLPSAAAASGNEEAADGAAEEAAPVRDRFPALDWHALWADETEDEWIVEPLLPARRLVALFSPPKLGKSLLMLELAVGVARGEAVLGYKPDKPRRVLYVDFENDPRGDVRTRLQAMGRGPDDLSDLVYLSYPRLAYLDSAIGALELLAVCEEYGIEVVVIDTISRAVAGEENDNDTWLSFYRHTGLALKAAGIAAIRLDHTGKDPTKGMRGGSAKYGDVDAVWSMTGVSETTFRLECTANRLPITEKVLVIRRDTHPKLRHAVEMGGMRGALDARTRACADRILQLGVDVTGGRGVPSACEALREVGLYPVDRSNPATFTKRTVEAAVAHIKDPNGINAWTPPEEEL